VGWLTGWLNVVPNAILAFYYAWKHKPEVVYTSQVGDGHICIPLCVGIFALYHTFTMPSIFQAGMWILFVACAVHIFFVALFGRLPRFVGLLLVIAYGCFLYKGLLG
jgi:cation:H+ antiporter